ncbi:DUF2239 family protein [Phyllobacterium myrsinacearum]|uniref:DUF2239 domain-containing protein n=1 Tax=Phyllobacterium myrsinacearum TaxID=28101 RepID=A0A839EKU1_9HYPH|nr:DUF2239 family protein [Phyllobacterium myrsinacearum]MBA8878855.1 hypothetical protein [Phyllobacterium myrsinacearum]
MTDYLSKPCTAFDGNRILSSGPLIEVALAVKNASEATRTTQPLLVFDDATGRAIDFDLRGTKADIIARLLQSSTTASDQSSPPQPTKETASDLVETTPRGRGRPKLGVIAREVTLLPRHWDWLATQSGGASVVLRRLVDEARKAGGGEQKSRAAQEAAYHFMSAMAGNLPYFEEAIRALFAGDRESFAARITDWPEDLSRYATKLAYGERTLSP